MIAFLAIAALCELFAFSSILMVVGSGVLLVYSPMMVAFCGLIAYVQWARHKPAAPPSWNMQEKLPQPTQPTTECGACGASQRFRCKPWCTHPAAAQSPSSY